MAGEGNMLQVAREEKNWSYLDAEEVTKISVRYIQALEAEKYDILPGRTYAKGYLRTYAKHLGLNPDEIVAFFNTSAEPEPTPVYKPPKPTDRKRPFWLGPLLIGLIAVLAIILVIVVSGRYRSGDETANSDDLPTLPKSPQTEPHTNVDDPSGSGASSTVGPEGGQELLPEEVPRNPDGNATQAGLRAKLDFTEDCWMLIRIDGEPEYQILYLARTSNEITAKERIEFITIGNAPSLKVTLNGKELPSFADGGRVIRNIVLTRDTLIE